MTFQFEGASLASCGMREYQEDNSILHKYDTQKILAVLCDGMGGHAGGAVVSKIACENFIQSYLQEGNTNGALKTALNASNVAIAKQVEKDASLDGMGCTLVGVFLSEQGLRWVSVGDSLLYLYRSGKLSRLNADHSYGGYLDKLVESGEMRKEEALLDPQRNSLLSAVIGEHIELIDLEEDFPLNVNDTILIASDGILSLSDNMIKRIIEFNSEDGGNTKTLVHSLIQAVEDQGLPYQDNTTIIAVEVK